MHISCVESICVLIYADWEYIFELKEQIGLAKFEMVPNNCPELIEDLMTQFSVAKSFNYILKYKNSQRP